MTASPIKHGENMKYPLDSTDLLDTEGKARLEAMRWPCLTREELDALPVLSIRRDGETITGRYVHVCTRAITIEMDSPKGRVENSVCIPLFAVRFCEPYMNADRSLSQAGLNRAQRLLEELCLELKQTGHGH